MNYLIYIERSAENLQFFLWHRDYVQRFKEAKTSDIALAPEWTPAMEEETAARIQKEHADKVRRDIKTPAIAIFKGTDFEKTPSASPQVVAVDRDPFSTPPGTPSERDRSTDFAADSNQSSYRSQATDAFLAAGVKAPCTYPPSPHPTHVLTPPPPQSQSNPSGTNSTASSPPTSPPAPRAN